MSQECGFAAAESDKKQNYTTMTFSKIIWLIAKENYRKDRLVGVPNFQACSKGKARGMAALSANFRGAEIQVFLPKPMFMFVWICFLSASSFNSTGGRLKIFPFGRGGSSENWPYLILA